VPVRGVRALRQMITATIGITASRAARDHREFPSRDMNCPALHELSHRCAGLPTMSPLWSIAVAQ
jgi:hypothetical protein